MLLLLYTGLVRSMPNADQNHGIDPKCLSMPLNADQFQSIPLNADQCPSMPDQGISKTLVNTVSTLQVAAALHSQNI